MRLTLDHLVYATPHLAETVAELTEALGLRAAEGGRHLGFGTRNHLLGLGGASYLEIVGPDPEQEAPAEPRPFGIDGLTAAALVTWAVACPGIDEAVARARRHGHDPGEPRTMTRRTPEGDLLRWRLTMPDLLRHDGLVPFLIDWGTTRHPAAAGLPSAALLSLGGVHPEPARVRHDLAALGAELDLAEGPRPRLTAVLEGPAGRVTLTG
ncbi:hypothetical protein Misp01_49740 [Microtetraspora sp. NBRC 13810]|uniref:VOC family protein n=1 Tax=Microtetraspora sp. NBRC 13810 TaxID=3030990 RepID=UPI0024A44C4C|nr:VOC family protein [Microtetraspora sp. NBRC 13810]GLW09845.1 hypothetical protein Misp01_49740 [Microtetraspora sp. NBRC 13810]